MYVALAQSLIWIYHSVCNKLAQGTPHRMSCSSSRMWHATYVKGALDYSCQVEREAAR